MTDILNDPPLTYPGGLPPINPDEAREALLALNRLAFGDRGAHGLTVRSVVEDGADVNAADNLPAFQATVDIVAAAGGGIALVPLGTFHLNGTLTIPINVILRGLGDRSVIQGNPGKELSAIRFAPGMHRGGLEDLQILGDMSSPPPIGIDRKYPPAEPGALGCVSRSKRLEEVANATSQGLGHRSGGRSSP